MWRELSREICLVAKAERDSNQEEKIRFPDPATLNAVERRLLVRSVAAFVEALSFSMKALALESSNVRRFTTEAERMLAAELAHDLTTTGEIKVRRAKLPTLSNVRFAFRLLAKVEDADYRLDASTEGWQVLRHTMAIRDRLMHPKALGDLTVTDTEIRDALHAYRWFESQVVLLLSSLVESLRAQAAETKRLQAVFKAEFGKGGDPQQTVAAQRRSPPPSPPSGKPS